jgi:hypothetical protein
MLGIDKPEEMKGEHLLKWVVVVFIKILFLFLVKFFFLIL